LKDFYPFFTVRTHDRLNVRIEHARDLDHLARVKAVVDGNHQHTRSRNMCLNKDAWLGGITRDGRHAEFPQLLDAFAILLGHHECYTALGQHFANSATDTAIAHKHDMSGKSALVNGHWKLRERIIAALHGASKSRARSYPVLNGLDGLENQRIERN
jgi:hypothetical protein